ncbi:MAG: hypothetical protein F6J87_26145 [Spirulina sp. SIO3F2]|nr:hypothetical protein [Spirulina sp. SIO3F2]
MTTLHNLRICFKLTRIIFPIACTLILTACQASGCVKPINSNPDNFKIRVTKSCSSRRAINLSIVLFKDVSGILSTDRYAMGQSQKILWGIQRRKNAENSNLIKDIEYGVVPDGFIELGLRKPVRLDGIEKVLIDIDGGPYNGSFVVHLAH